MDMTSYIFIINYVYIINYLFDDVRKVNILE